MDHDVIGDLPARMKAIRRDVKDEYLAPHRIPWIVGFSGGKDSTLVLQLVFEMLLSIPPQVRQRRIFVATNDTLVESPAVRRHVDTVLVQVREGVEALGLPVTVEVTTPDLDETFWVNLLGRGYPAPNRSFRWCTDRMKIRPTTRLLARAVSETGQAILLLGARRAESAARARIVKRYPIRNGRLNDHNGVENCQVFRPIVNLSDDDVWQVLTQCRPPWGGTHRALVTLYRNANGGECPFVTSNDDSPSCGTSSPRFGCWTCTVVEKDHSMAGLIDSGAYDALEPLFEFRQRIKEVSASPQYRSKVRRNGEPGLGPLTFEARQMLLDELRAIEAETAMVLIGEEEVRRIRALWEQDRLTSAIREVLQLEMQASLAAE